MNGFCTRRAIKRIYKAAINRNELMSPKKTHWSEFNRNNRYTRGIKPSKEELHTLVVLSEDYRKYHEN